MRIGKYTITIKRANWTHCFFDIVISWDDKEENKDDIKMPDL